MNEQEMCVPTDDLRSVYGNNWSVNAWLLKLEIS
jgi:hypothetical protein